MDRLSISHHRHTQELQQQSNFCPSPIVKILQTSVSLPTQILAMHLYCTRTMSAVYYILYACY